MHACIDHLEKWARRQDWQAIVCRPPAAHPPRSPAARSPALRLPQPATATSAPAAAPITLIGRQRPRKHASPAASSPTASCAAKACFREGAAAPLLRRRCVLVAKQLTNSDASSGRIILPRVAGEEAAPCRVACMSCRI